MAFIDRPDETAAMPTVALPTVVSAESDPGRRGIMSSTPVRIVVWTAVAALAIGVAAGAVAAASAGRDILSAGDVAAQLAAAGPGGAAPGDAQPGDDQLDPNIAAGPGTVVGTPAGTVVVQCQGDLASLVSWSPNPGFRADDVVRGPAVRVSVWFESDRANDVQVEATCTNGAPVARQNVEEDDHGGHGHDGGGSDGSSSGSDGGHG
jgi:hypothetical protein